MLSPQSHGVESPDRWKDSSRESVPNALFVGHRTGRLELVCSGGVQLEGETLGSGGDRSMMS